MNLRVQYGEDTVTVLEIDDGNRYEVAHWHEDELDENPDLLDIVENAETLAKENPRELIKRLYGSVDAWERQRENRQWD